MRLRGEKKADELEEADCPDRQKDWDVQPHKADGHVVHVVQASVMAANEDNGEEEDTSVPQQKGRKGASLKKPRKKKRGGRGGRAGSGSREGQQGCIWEGVLKCVAHGIKTQLAQLELNS